MRSATLSLVLSAAGLVSVTSATFEFFKPSELPISIAKTNFSSSLDCASCVRGGYDYCPFD